MANDDKLNQKIQLVYEKSETFKAVQPQGKAQWLKRLGRKLTFWYVHPFGTAQDEFNEATANALSEAEHRLRDLTEYTERQLAASTQEQRQALLRVQTQQQEKLAELDAKFSESLCIAAPESRAEVGVPPLTALPVVGSDALYQELHTVQNAVNAAQTKEGLERLDEAYTKLLQKSIQEKQQSPAGRKIALVTRKFANGNGMEAVKNEVWDLYRLMKTSSRYQCCIVSIEADDAAYAKQGDVCFVPEKMLAQWMDENDPILLIFCESNLEVLWAGSHCMLMRNSILRMSAENPAQAMGGSKLQEMLHLSDFGVQRYCTASQSSADRMEALGFRRPTVFYPYIDTEKSMFFRRPRAYEKSRFCVGFASSPMGAEQAESRGVPALCELVQQHSDMQFVVLWRDENAVPVPDVLRDAANCELRFGKCDMSQFFSDIDCILIPYANENYNHACSMSAVEGMLMGVPTISTPAAGVSELVSATGLGIVSEDASAASLRRALVQLREDYAAYLGTWRIDKLRNMLSDNSFVRYAEYCAEHAAPYGVVTIFEWDRQLKLENRHLVKGHAALKAYYQREDIAADYTAERFVTYPQNCFDLMERQSAAVLVSHYFGQQREDLRLLDLACGDGRILQTMLILGHCTAGDASPAMLSQVAGRFPDAPLDTMQIDLISDEITGKFDVITIFRFIRHYEYAVRKELWRKLREALTDRGVLLFDVPNLNFEVPNRQRTGWGKYNIYDVFWTKESIRQELADNGLQLDALIPIGQGLYPVPAGYRNEPMTWTAAVRKKF